jgi:uncharacterized protein (DUF885 family)
MLNARYLSITLILITNLTAHAGPAEDFRALLEEAWEWQLEQDPVSASSLGDRRFNDRWTDNSLQAIEIRHKQQQAFLDRVRLIDASQLSATDQLRANSHADCKRL